MKKVLTLLTILSQVCLVALSQTAILHVSIANSKSVVSSLNIPSLPQKNTIVLDGSNIATDTFKLTKPIFVQLNCSNYSDYANQHFNYLLFLSPGDNLTFTADMGSPGFAFKVVGKGSENNQPMLSAMEQADVYQFNGDTLPYRVITAIKNAQQNKQAKLDEYIKLYKPSKAYITDWKCNLAYYAPQLYYEFKEANKFTTGGAYNRNYAAWQKIMDSLFNTAKLNNDAALASLRYERLVDCFVSYERQSLEDSAYLNPVAFYREWYNTDTVEGEKQYSADTKNLVKEKIINHYFTGKTAEYLYTLLLNEAITTNNPQNIEGIFNRFKNKYPDNKYVAAFSRPVNVMVERLKRKLNDKMIFLTGNDKTYNTLDDVLAAMKGKTVLVDMWGTWCRPCREEIEKNSKAIREHFKDSKLEFLYIANNDAANEEKWKNMIAYFDMEGMHILAGSHLSDDIMDRVKGTGYPTVFIIKKDGTVELSKTEYPIHRDVLIKQLEDDLAE